jgi:hypothetical protein
MAVANNLTPAQITLLRRLTKEPDFRKSFFRNSAPAMKAAGLSAREAAAISKITPEEVDGLQRAAKAVGRGLANDSCTLVYAVAFAVAFAVLFLAADKSQGQTPAKQ